MCALDIALKLGSVSEALSNQRMLTVFLLYPQDILSASTITQILRINALALWIGWCDIGKVVLCIEMSAFEIMKLLSCVTTIKN